MKHFILVWAALAFLLGGIVPAAVQAGTIAYDIQNYPAEQNGHTLSGLIITDGTIGALATSNILSWTVTIDSSITFSGGASSAGIVGDVEASATQITMAQPPASPGLIGHTELFLGSDASHFLLWVRNTAPPPGGAHINVYKAVNGDPLNPVWDTNPEDSLGGTDPWVIAENPEPASLTLMSVGGVALLGYGWRRRRRTAE